MNILQVTKKCRVSAPRVQTRTFKPGDRVAPHMPYYLPLLWSDNAVDTGDSVTLIGDSVIKSKRVQSASGAVLLNSETETDAYGGRSIAVKNQGTNTAYLGGSDVSDTNGWALATGDTVAFDLQDSDKLYAYGTSIDLIVLQVGL